MFVEVSDLQPWVILSLNAGALKTTGEAFLFRLIYLHGLPVNCAFAAIGSWILGAVVGGAESLYCHVSWICLPSESGNLCADES